MAYISNGYYIFKFLQAFATITFLFLVFDTTKLCGEYVPQKSVRLSSSMQKCSDLTLYHLTLPTNSNPMDLHKLPPNHLNHIPPDAFPIGPHCMNISLGSSYERSFTRPIDPHQKVADLFAVPIAFAITYLVLLVVHTCIQTPPEYNSCQYMVVIFGAVTWTICYVEMAVLQTYWDHYWQCSNFLPQMPTIGNISLFITSALVISCVIEVLYNSDMMGSGHPNVAANKKMPRKAYRPAVNNGKQMGGAGTIGNNLAKHVTNPNCAMTDVKKQMDVFTISVQY